MTLRTRTPRAWLAGVIALLLASVGLSVHAPDGHAAPRKSRKSARATSTAKSSHAPPAMNPEVEAARTLLAAQDALPKIEEHMEARQDEEAAVLLDETRGRIAEALEATKDKRLRKDLEEVEKKTEKLADKLEDRRKDTLKELPPGAALVGPPLPASLTAAEPSSGESDPSTAAKTEGTDAKDPKDAGEVPPTEITNSGDLPLPGEENDPTYALPALDDTQIPIESHPLVDKWIDYFTGRGRPTFERWLERSGLYMDSMKAVLEKEGVPTDLVHLVFVESGFNLHARSRSHAVGPWQFIRGTANLFGLKVNSWVDERKDPQASTIAAARYLKHLHGLFGSWPLALASYNAGEGAVGRAIKRQGTKDFWKLRLPTETRNYVPKFMAVLAISRDPSRYGFDQVTVAEPLAFDEVTIPGPVDLRALAEACGTDAVTIKDLNPQYLRGAAPARNNEVTLRVPDGAGEKLMESLADGSLTLPQVSTPADPLVLRHRVRRGESLKAIALRYGVSASSIARYNGIRKSARLRVGRTLKIPTADGYYDASASGGTKVDTGRARTVRVKRGQTLSEIAAVHGVTVAQLRAANGMSPRAQLQAGQRLKIPRAS